MEIIGFDDFGFNVGAGTRVIGLADGSGVGVLWGTVGFGADGGTGADFVTGAGFAIGARVGAGFFNSAKAVCAITRLLNANREIALLTVNFFIVFLFNIYRNPILEYIIGKNKCTLSWCRLERLPYPIT